MERICEGQGKVEDLTFMEDIGETLQTASLCALGRTAANPVLSTLKYFRDEYLAHINEATMPGRSLPDLTEFYIEAELCTGCTLCVKNCPVDAYYW